MDIVIIFFCFIPLSLGAKQHELLFFELVLNIRNKSFKRGQNFPKTVVLPNSSPLLFLRERVTCHVSKTYISLG